MTTNRFLAVSLALLASAGLSPAVPLSDNLVAYWSFEGNANNDTSATGGTAYNGTLMGGATTSGAPRVGTGALSLDGVDDYMDVTTIVDAGQPWSVQAWFRPTDSPANTSTGANRYFVFESSAVSTMSFGLRGYDGAALGTNTRYQTYTRFAPSGGTEADSKVGDFDMLDTATTLTWHHILLVCTPPTPSAAGSVIGYLDGKQRYTGTVPAGATMAPVSGIHFGTFRDANGRWFKGVIDEAAIWNRTLTNADALDLFHRGRSGQAITATVTDPALDSGLLAYYDFEQTGSAGLINKAPGATSYNGTRGQWSGTDPDWATGADATGPGFAGNAAFNGEGGASDRSDLLVGNALNLDDARNEYVNVALGAAQTGSAFTISAWHALTPSSGNNSNRYHVFEPGDSGNYDISWGTNAVTTTTGPLASYTYLAYVAGGPAGGFGPTGVSTGPWHHVAHVFTSDGTKTYLSVYLNGVFVESRTTEVAGTMDFTSINLGRARIDQNDRDWDGMMDEVAVWNRAMSPAQVQELCTKGSGGSPLIGGNKLTVSLSATPSGAGTVSGSGYYDPNTQVSISATPDLGYVFISWSGPFNGRPASFTHTLTADATSVATFGPDTADTDGDGLSNYDEVVVHQTQLDDPDSDNDGMPDGVEVNQTGTSPIQDDSALVDYVRDNLSPASAGAIAILTPVIERDPLTGALTLKVAFQGSADQRSWSAIPLTGSEVSITPDGNHLHVTLPAPSSSVDSYILIGGRP